MTLPSILPAQGKQPYPSPESYFQRGTSPLNLVYTGAANQTALTATAVHATRDIIRAYPIVIGDVATVDTLYVEATGVVANAVGRVAIYRGRNDQTIYPGSLVVESGEVAVATAVVRAVAVSKRLAPGIYWLATLFGVADPAIRAIAPGGVNHILGLTSALAINTYLGVAFPYAPFPDTFPDGATPTAAANVAAVGLHFSA